MASNREEHQLGSVFDISGEPAIIIDGVPDVGQSGHFHLHNVIEAERVTETERAPIFGNWMEGREVSKLFGDQYFSGTVTGFDQKTGWYRVEYVDGDFEDLEWHELEEILVPLDITIPLKTLALKTLKKNQMHVHKTTGNQHLPRRRHTRLKADQ